MAVHPLLKGSGADFESGNNQHLTVSNGADFESGNNQHLNARFKAEMWTYRCKLGPIKLK